MIKIRPGLILAFLGMLCLLLGLINQGISYLEKALISIFCSLLIAFGVLLENGVFPEFVTEFNEEQKF